MKLLLFKISSCEQCKNQERVYKEHSINYIPCELFKNRDLARRYGVTDVPCSVIIEEFENNAVEKFARQVTDKRTLEKIKSMIE